MGRVYESGLITISVNLASDETNWEPLLPHEMPAVGRAPSPQEFWLESMLLGGPLSKRAWCLQERYLSPRILHVFGNKFWIWECNSRVRGCGYKSQLFRVDIKNYALPWRKIAFNQYLELHPDDIIELWDRAVEDYAQRRLSYVTDKLPAMSGVASKFQQFFKCKYLAGIWEVDLYGLMWRHKGYWHSDPWPPVVAQEVVNDPPAYVAPSWSWASNKQPAEIEIPSSQYTRLQRSHCTLLAELTGSNIITHDGNVLGQVRERSHITISGYFWPLKQSGNFDCSIDKNVRANLDYSRLLVIGIEYEDKYYPAVYHPTVFGLMLVRLDPASLLFSRVGVFRIDIDDQYVKRSKRKIDMPKFKTAMGRKREVTIV